MNRQLEGRLYVVTGASGGIGGSCIEVLQRDGAIVVGVDRESASAADVHVAADLAGEDCIDAVAAAVGGRPLHGLVNVAAASTTVQTSDVDAALWDHIFAVNVRAPFLLAEGLLPRMVEAGHSCVVNVASVHAFATSPGAVPYAASKGALVALTRATAVDWAARGLDVRAVGIVPGAIDTAMLRDGLARTGLSIDELAARHPSGRVGEPGEVAELVAFVLSDRAVFVNGETITIDGGALAQLSTEVDERARSGP